MNNKSPTERANELYHHGIKGQKWGVRRFQNADGTLTDAGYKRYNRKDMEREGGEVYKKRYDELYKKHDMEGKEFAVFKYLDSQGLEWDDTDDKADAMWEAYKSLDEKLCEEASQAAKDYLVKKYGEESVSRLKKTREFEAGVARVAAMGALIAVPAAIIFAATRK